VTLDTTPTIFIPLDDSVLLNTSPTGPIDAGDPRLPFQTTGHDRVTGRSLRRRCQPGTGAARSHHKLRLGFATGRWRAWTYTFHDPGTAPTEVTSCPLAFKILTRRHRWSRVDSAGSESFGNQFVDSVAPPVSFGRSRLVDDGLHPDRRHGQPEKHWSNAFRTISPVTLDADVLPVRRKPTPIVRMFWFPTATANVGTRVLIVPGQDVAVPL